ncbi:hypothetical protein PG637_02550 [Riemerella anatipestifer]|nr:hypothetical protein [Riemerella anatipestifer]MDY3324552.1 hypothetical protein [Riemerella anatipestifer]MDY3353362.1 hypothetical protein [Riemerella anatipestifer]
MRKFSNTICTLLISTLLLSCGDGRRTDNNKPTKQETPKALQDDKLEIKSYSRSGDLTEELYQELVDKTPQLKQFEDDLAAFGPKPNNLNEKFNQYDSKSNNYYSSANYKATAISDSLLRMKIIALITTSSKKYASKNTELNSLIKQISKNGSTLNDQHTVLKIVLTLPLIEKYQDDNKLNKKEFQDAIKEQEKLILQADSLTPKY